MTHTPGPWEWTIGQNDPHRELIRTGSMIGEYDSIVYHGADWPMKEADARLIAAAPEMFEVLRDLILNRKELMDVVQDARQVLARINER